MIKLKRRSILLLLSIVIALQCVFAGEETTQIKPAGATVSSHPEHHNFPELQGNISGGNFPPPQHAIYLQNIVGCLHIAAVAFIAFGDKIWSFLPFFSSPPWWYMKCKDNAMQTFIFLFLVIPSIVQSMHTTGAFEITLDGVTLFSRIESGQFPSAPQLLELFKNAGISQL